MKLVFKQKGSIPLIAVVIILVLLVLSGGYYYYTQNYPSQNNSSNYIPLNNIQNPTSPSAMVDSTNEGLSQKDLDAIKKSLALKDTNVNPAQVSLTTDLINKKYPGKFASGSYHVLGEGGGARWFAQNKNGQWMVFYVTNGVPDCTDIDQYNAPRDLLPCLDSAGNVINK